MQSLNPGETPGAAATPGLLPPAPPTGRPGVARPGLSSIAAYRRLFEVADGALRKWQLDKPRLFIWSISPNLDVFTTRTLRVWPTDRLTPLSCAMTMIGAAVIIGLCNIHEHYRSTELAVEAIVLALSAILLLGIILHERKLRHIELASRLEAIIKKFRMMERHGVSLNHYSDLKDLFPSSSCDRVPTWRDGALVGVPAVLLVKDDRVILKPGDRAPATVRLMPKGDGNGTSNAHEHTGGFLMSMEPGEAFMGPEGLGAFSGADGRPASRGQPPKEYDFVVLEGVLEQNLEVMYTVSRSRRRTALNSERILSTLLVQRFAMVIWLTVRHP